MKWFFPILLVLSGLAAEAGDFSVQADSFNSVLNFSLVTFRVNMSKLINTTTIRKNDTTIKFTFESAAIPTKCSRPWQSIEMLTDATEKAIKQTFVFIDCRGANETMIFTRRGAHINPMTLDDFLGSNWGLLEGDGTWSLEISWSKIRLSSERHGGTQTSRILLDLQFTSSTPGTSPFALYLSLQLNESSGNVAGSKVLTRQYNLRVNQGGTQTSYMIKRDLPDSSLFANEQYTQDNLEITPKTFSDFYQNNIIAEVVQFLDSTLGGFPLLILDSPLTATTGSAEIKWNFSGSK